MQTTREKKLFSWHILCSRSHVKRLLTFNLHLTTHPWQTASLWMPWSTSSSYILHFKRWVGRGGQAKYGMLHMRDSFTRETSSSKSCSARKICRNSGFHSTVFTLHGPPFMQFLRFGAHAQELWPLVSTWYVPCQHTWSFQLWGGACRFSFGQWNWPSDFTEHTSWTNVTVSDEFYVLSQVIFLSPKIFILGLCYLLT